MTPDYFAPLTAWRRFALTHSNSVLMSVNQQLPWPSAESPEACCIVEASMPFSRFPPHLPDEPCPKQDCCCGFYAFTDRADAEQHDQGSVLARVVIWGRVVVHTRGYRAARMRICELFISHPLATALPALRARYHVPITIEELPSWTLDNRSAPLSSSPSSYQASQLQQAIQTMGQFQGRLMPYPPSNQVPPPPNVFAVPSTSPWVPAMIVPGASKPRPEDFVNSLDDREVLALTRALQRRISQRGRLASWFRSRRQA